MLPKMSSFAAAVRVEQTARPGIRIVAPCTSRIVRLAPLQHAPLSSELISLDAELAALGGGAARIGRACVTVRIRPRQSAAGAAPIISIVPATHPDSGGKPQVAVLNPSASAGPMSAAQRRFKMDRLLFPDAPQARRRRRRRRAGCADRAARHGVSRLSGVAQGALMTEGPGEEALAWVLDGFSALVIAVGQSGRRGLVPAGGLRTAPQQSARPASRPPGLPAWRLSRRPGRAAAAAALPQRENVFHVRAWRRAIPAGCSRTGTADSVGPVRRTGAPPPTPAPPWLGAGRPPTPRAAPLFGAQAPPPRRSASVGASE